MAEIRVNFSAKEYKELKTAAEYLGLSIKELVHIRAIGESAEDNPLCTTKLLCLEISKYRQVLNQIIQRETTAEIKLFEDDMIAMELSMAGLEAVVANFVKDQTKKVKRNGDSDI